MGKGNPESADVIFARDPDIFVADKLSNKNKTQAEGLGVEWVQLRQENGYQKFLQILRKLDVPHTEFSGDINERLNQVFQEIFE